MEQARRARRVFMALYKSDVTRNSYTCTNNLIAKGVPNREPFRRT